MPDFRPILCVDFDGVCHRYSDGWRGGEIYDPITDGFWEWAGKAAAAFTLVIYSSRSKTPKGRDDMRMWLEGQWSLRCLRKGVPGRVHHDADASGADATLTLESDGDAPITFAFAAEKPAAWLTIDDRALRFDGNWDDPAFSPEAMLAFKPWMTRPKP